MQAKGRSIRSFYAVAVAAIVLTMAGVLQAAPAAGVPSVDPKLATQLQHDPTTGYLIYFNNKPDLTPAYKKAQPERARWVVNQLTAAATRPIFRQALSERAAHPVQVVLDRQRHRCDPLGHDDCQQTAFLQRDPRVEGEAGHYSLPTRGQSRRKPRRDGRAEHRIRQG